MIMLIQIDHVLKQYIDTLIAAVPHKISIRVAILSAEDPTVEIDDSLCDLVRV